MNGKQAKRLRKAAMGLATVLTDAGKDIKKAGYQVKVHDNRLSASSVFASDYDPKGVMERSKEDPNARFEVEPSYQLLVRKDSLKGIYKTLKSGKA